MPDKSVRVVYPYAAMIPNIPAAIKNAEAMEDWVNTRNIAAEVKPFKPAKSKNAKADKVGDIRPAHPPNHATKRNCATTRQPKTEECPIICLIKSGSLSI